MPYLSFYGLEEELMALLDGYAEIYSFTFSLVYFFLLSSFYLFILSKIRESYVTILLSLK